MKQRPKGILALCTALLLVLLGGCQGRGVPPLPRTASSPSRQGEHHSGGQRHPDRRRPGGRGDGFPGPASPGGGGDLLAAPGGRGGRPGGTCQVEGDTATVRWLDQTVVYTIGAPGAQRNGDRLGAGGPPGLPGPRPDPAPEAVVPPRCGRGCGTSPWPWPSLCSMGAPSGPSPPRTRRLGW